MLESQATWLESIKAFLHPRVVTMLFYGFSAGIPLLLIFSSLGLWLVEAGVERAQVTYFSWAALAYSFKFIWAPLVDRLPIPVLTRTLGRRRAWLLVSHTAIAFSIVAIASLDPSRPGLLTLMAFAVVALGFSAATQDIVIDAYRIESASPALQALMSSTYIAGYRIGMIVSGGGSLIIASALGSTKEHYSYEAWQMTYLIMALTCTVGILTTLMIPEPQTQRADNTRYSSRQYLKFLCLFVVAVGALIATYMLTASSSPAAKELLSGLFHNTILANFLVELLRLAAGVGMAAVALRILSYTPLYEKELVESTYIAPVRDFFHRYGTKLALILLLFIGFYRVSDIVLGVISSIFFEETGFTKDEIGVAVKGFGMVMTITGGFLGGIFALHYGVVRTLYLGAILTVLTNLLFVWLAHMGPRLEILYIVISADNLSAGIASAAFVAFLSRLTNVSFTAMQYAIFSSLMTLMPKLIGGYSGSMVENMGYSNFFLLASLMGVPVLGMIWLVQRHGNFRG